MATQNKNLLKNKNSKNSSTNAIDLTEEKSCVKVEHNTPVLENKHNRYRKIDTYLQPKDNISDSKLSLDDSDVIPPTPEYKQNTSKISSILNRNQSSTPLSSTKLKSKFSQINAVSKKIQQKKVNSKTENNKLIAADITPKITKSLIDKKSSSIKKLTLTKPRKRRCNFSPSDQKETSKKIEKKCIMPEIEAEALKVPSSAHNSSDDACQSDFLRGYGCVEDNKVVEIYEKQMTLVKPKLAVENILADSSFNDSLMNDLISIDGCNKVVTDDIISEVPSKSDDSLLDFDLSDDLTPPESNETPHLLVWEISDVRTSSYEHNSGYTTTEKILTLCLRQKDILVTCHLRDDWCHMQVEVNDLAYVSGLSCTKLVCVLDNKSTHHITLFPNTLISGTAIATGITCERRAVLDQQFRIGDQNQAMLLGNMTHDLFQWAVQNKNFSITDLEEKAKANLKSIEYLEALYAINSDETELLQKIREYFTPIQEWYKSFVLSSQGKEIEFKTGHHASAENVNAMLHVDDITDIEENIWSPVYGLKGKIDLSISVTVHRQPKLKSVEKYKLPLEVKTGKMFSKLGTIEHRAQVAVYTLLMSEKYNSLIDTGLLYYMKTNHMQGIPRPEQEKRAIIIKRNDIARKLTLEKKNNSLPGLLRNPRQCKRCYQNTSCMLCYKALDRGEGQSSGVEELFKELTGHLTNEDITYFRKWYELCMLETSFSVNKNKERNLWLKSSTEREKQGFCFSQMVLRQEDETSDGKIHYKFQRNVHHFNTCTSLQKIPLVVGDRVIISEENSNVFNITTGYIVGVDAGDVVVSAHHKIRSVQSEALYRIDKDDTLSNYSTQLSNLCMLFSKESNRDLKLRKLIVNGHSPSFSAQKEEDLSCTQLLASDRSNSSFKASQAHALNSIFTSLNPAQISAIEKCLVADDYVMILGMPGAGKSTTTACLVRALVSMGKSVLLTSYTHSAVDTILLKLLEVDFHQFLRLGQKSRIHSKILPYSSYECTKNFTTTNQLRNFYNSQTVVATTCLGVQHAIFKHKSFDYCIVDEASQITQPVCVGPIRYANTFILVGDHNQLPPLVQCEEARLKGLDVSLFRDLSEKHPEAVVTLDRQYRMHDAIMTLTNQLVYNNRMKCGNETVATALLNLPLYDYVQKETKHEQLFHVINPRQPVVFVNTDSSEFKETKTEAHLVNVGEARLVKTIIEMFLKCGLSHKDIGVISPYKHQLKVIRHELNAITLESDQKFIEVDTIDKYQGKDKRCVIVSLVRSNNGTEVGTLLKDWRRINVAITRAKHKLILIGSRKTIMLSKTFQRLMTIIDRHDYCIDWKT